MKKEGQELNEFAKLLHKTQQRNTKVQTHWAEVTHVNWEAKTMTVKGLTDGLEFYDVLLGLGASYAKPKVGSKCLIGIIMNNEAASFLIHAEAVEEYNYTIGDNHSITVDTEKLNVQINNTMLTIDSAGFLIKKENETLKACLNDMIDELNKIIVIKGRTINVAAMNVIKQRLNTVLTS